MKTQEKVEREIDLRELFWNILLGWRQIACFAIIAAVLFVGMKYVLDMRAYRVLQNTDVGQAEEFTREEEEQLSSAKDMIARIDEYQKYLDTSPLMQLNPYEKHIIVLQYYVESDYTYDYTKENQNDYTGSLMTLYYNYITGGEISRNVIKELELSSSQAELSELWSISQIGNFISIQIASPEENKLEDIAKFIKEQLSLKESEFQQIGSHKLKLIDESRNVIVDTALIDRKNAISNNIASINAQLNVLKANMTEQQINRIYSDGESASGIEKVIAVKPVFNKKYFILGAFIGIFLVCAWIACKMIFTARLQSSEEIRNFYDVRFLGEVPTGTQKKRFLSVIDSKILALKNRRKKKLSVEQQIKVIAANIVLYCKQQGVRSIYMTGSEYENVDAAVLDMLKQELIIQNIQVKEGGNIFYDAESLKQGTEIGNIVFVEQTGISIYDEIANELELAREQKNCVLGVVVLV